MRNKLHHLTFMGYIAGFSWLVMATWRWWFIYPDISTLIIANTIGIGIIFATYVYNWMRDKDKEFNNYRDLMNDRLDHLQSGIAEVNKGWI